MDANELLASVQEGRATLTIIARSGRGRATAAVVDTAGTRTEVHLTLRTIEQRQQATMKLYRSKAMWTVNELEEKGLPLYWSRSWLVRQLTEHKSLTAIELITGYPRETLTSWKRRHAITGDPRKDAIRKEWDSGKFPTQQELAAAYDVSLPTLRTILRDR